MPELPQMLEITVSASNWDEAKNKLAAVGIDNKSDISERNINGLYVVMLQPNRDFLTDSFYQAIRGHKDISILSDTSSWERCQEVTKEIYKVEVELRKLLLHIIDLVDVYYELFSKAPYAKDHAKGKHINRKNDLNPLSAKLMLGDMIYILGFNLSWTNKLLNGNNLNKLIEDSESFIDFKNNVHDKLKSKLPWSIISENVLSVPVKWTDIEPKLSGLKNYRNQAAHFNIMTGKERDEAIALAKEVFSTLTQKREFTKLQRQAIKILSDSYAKDFQSKMSELAKNASVFQPNKILLDSINAHNNYAKNALEAASAHNAAVLESFTNSLKRPTVADIFKELDVGE